MVGIPALVAANATGYSGDTKAESRNDSDAAPTEAQIETAQYIADMILELRNMAKGAGLYSTMVPLEYAYYEAFSVANRVNVTQKDVDRINRLGDDVKAAGAK